MNIQGSGIGVNWYLHHGSRKVRTWSTGGFFELEWIAPDLPYAPGWWLRYPQGPGYWDSVSRLLPVAAVAGAEMWKSGGQLVGALEDSNSK